MKSLSCSVLLCTKNRTREIERFLDSLAAQTNPVDEVLVIDGGSSSIVAQITETFRPHFKSIRYSVVQGDLTVARNLGVSLAKADILFFLDDDLVLESHFIGEIMHIFGEDKAGEGGGGCGNIANHIRQKGLRLFLNKIFFLPGDGNGRFRISGAATWVYGLPQTQFVEFLPGGLTAYRRDVFKEGGFDESLPLFGFTDDVDFSYRVSKKFKNFYTPKAIGFHERPSSDRAMSFYILRTWIWAYWRTYRRNRGKNWIGYPALYLLTLGFIFKFIESHLKFIGKFKIRTKSEPVEQLSIR